MADCLTTAEIEGLLADTLSPADKARAEAHLAACDKCRQEVERGQADNELFGKIKQAYEAETLSKRDQPVESHARPTPPTESIEGYEILSEVHRGGQGVVYKAVQKPTKRTVALKVLLEGPYASPRQRHRFEREIDLVASLQHPNIVTVYDSGVTRDGRHFFAMEYIHGQPLDACLSDKSLSIDETLRLFQRICAAVNHAHQHGVIHRDLKPGNIRVDATGEPHVLDFGLAKAGAGGLTPDGAPVTVTGEFMGTLAYASPEQTKGDPTLIDIRTDVYSLGVILYEMLTGKYPYEVVGQMADVLKNIAEAEPKRPSTIRRQVNDEVETIVLKSLAKEKERRYQSVETLGRDIEHYLSGQPIDAKRDSTWYVIRKSLRRYRLAVAVAAAFVLLLGASTVALSIMYQNQTRERQRAEAALTREAEQRRIAEHAEREQSRARKEAEQARTAEEEQRKVAEQREKEATEASELAQQRTDQLETVTKFQALMLSQIDAEQMGRGIIADQRERIAERLENEGASAEQIEAALASFDELTAEVNATNLALKVVDENVLARAAETIEKEFAEQPVVEAALHQTLGEVYHKLGLHQQALPQMKRALALRRRVLGDDHPDTLSSLHAMGGLLASMGELAEARSRYREALEGCRRVLGDDHPLTVLSRGELSLVERSAGSQETADKLMLEQMQRLFGGERSTGDLQAWGEAFILAELRKLWSSGEHGAARALIREKIAPLTNMPVIKTELYDGVGVSAMLRLEVGDLDTAEPLLREALEGNRRVLGDDHLYTLRSIRRMGYLLERQGKVTEAQAYYREALEGQRRVLGDDHPDTLASIDNMGALFCKMGKYEEAEPYYSEALEARRRVLGDDHSDTLTSINNMGALLYKMGKYEEAEPYYSEALEARRRVLGADDPKTLSSLAWMGLILKTQGKLDEAGDYYREALEGRRRVLGDDDPDTLRSVADMGAVLKAQGKLAEAEPYYREALEGRRRVLGDDHSDTLTSINNMGALLYKMGKYEEAEPYYSEALEGRRRVLGDDDPKTLSSLAWMGSILKTQGKLDEAGDYYREALEGRRRVLGDDDPDTLRSVAEMGAVLKAQGKLDEAETYLREALEGRRRVLGDDHPATLASINNMGYLLQSMGKLAEAEALFREALATRRRVLGDDHPSTLTSINNMGYLLQSMGKLAEAEALFRERLGVRRRTRPEGDRAIGMALSFLVENLAEQKKYGEAEPLLRECLDIRQKALPEGHWLIFNAMSMLGDSLAGQEKFAEAEALLLDGYEGMKDHPQARDDHKGEALERILKLYETWHEAEPDQGYDAKAAEWRAKLPTTQPAPLDAARPLTPPTSQPATRPAQAHEAAVPQRTRI